MAKVKFMKIMTRGGASRAAIMFKEGQKLPGGMVFRAYDDANRPNVFAQCPYCGTVVSISATQAKKNHSCGCMKNTRMAKGTVMFAKGWIFDAAAGRDAHNHPLVTVHSRWDETDVATFRLGNLKSGKVRWAASIADDGVDEMYSEMYMQQARATIEKFELKMINEMLKDIKDRQKLYSCDEAFTYECLSKKYKKCLCDNTVYTADSGVISHNGTRFFNNEPFLADFQLNVDGIRVFIENNGPIHYEDIYGIKTLAERQARDRRVAQFCKDNGFVQIVVDYKMIMDRDEAAYTKFLNDAIKNGVKAQKKANRAAAKAKAKA